MNTNKVLTEELLKQAVEQNAESLSQVYLPKRIHSQVFD